MEAKDKGMREAVEASDAARKEKLRVASSKVKGPNDKLPRFVGTVTSGLATVVRGSPGALRAKCQRGCHPGRAKDPYSSRKR